MTTGGTPLLSIPLLGDLISRETQEVLELSNRITIEVLTASFRAVRGRTIVAALLDELAFFMTDESSSSPDTEIVAAIKPSMATVPGAVLLKASSPYARRGVLWEDYRKFFGKDDADVLVWQAPTRRMNPTVPESFIAAEVEKDPANAAAEFGAEFRTDVESFVSREVVEACTMHGRFEVPPLPGCNYVAWVDPSGGSSDSMTLAIARNEDGNVVLHAAREVVPPFSPQSVVAEFCALLKQYGIGFVVGDRYAGMWPREQFAAHGVSYRVADLTASEVYQAFLPLLAFSVPKFGLPSCSGSSSYSPTWTHNTGEFEHRIAPVTGRWGAAFSALLDDASADISDLIGEGIEPREAA
jgi:hypothetical protein